MTDIRKKSYHFLGNKILKFEEDNLTNMKPILNDIGEIVGYIEE